jgi:hypothetical protein
MKSYFIAIILTFGVLQSYSQSNYTTNITISSSNLSEDMKYSLTKDDELLLIYKMADTNKTLSKPLFLNRFNFNDSIKEKKNIGSFKPSGQKPSVLLNRN